MQMHRTHQSPLYTYIYTVLQKRCSFKKTLICIRSRNKRAAPAAWSIDKILREGSRAREPPERWGEGKEGEREIEGAERATATYFIASKVNGRFIKGGARARGGDGKSPMGSC